MIFVAHETFFDKKFYIQPNFDDATLNSLWYSYETITVLWFSSMY